MLDGKGGECATNELDEQDLLMQSLHGLHTGSGMQGRTPREALGAFPAQAPHRSLPCRCA